MNQLLYQEQYNKQQVVELSNIITFKRGVWLSGEYYNGKSVISVQCEHGHTWSTKLRNIKNNRWCPTCAKIKVANVKRRNAHISKITKQVEHMCSTEYYFYRWNKLLSKVRRSRQYRSRISRLGYNKSNGRSKYRQRYYNDTAFRLNERIKSQFRKCLIKDRSMGKYYELLGYTTEDLYSHLELLFKDGMSWDNIGQWHIDHVKPKCLFTLTDKNGAPIIEEIKKCWGLDNLQPLWAEDNMRKGKKYFS